MYARALVLILFFASVATSSIAQPSANPGDQSIVTTDRGPVRGMVASTLRMYLGIPYASPPVGRLRWRPPKVHERWSTPLNTIKFENHCPQEASVFGKASVTEDCLYLNVFTPNVSEEANICCRYPVMVWIHGGALTVGESDDYVPTNLVQQGVIVVTFNYRLGALGFLAHPAFSAESPDHISGNYGIMDQQFALKWVHRNIASFGGNPDQVTVFGESAGGLSVLLQLASSLAAGLFHGAIAESGSYGLTTPTLADEEQHGQSFAASVGCVDQNARCLRSISTKKILANWGLFDSSPNVDGKVLSQSPDTAFATGQFNHVPLIHGTTHDEWRFFVALFFDLSGATITPDEYPSVVESMVGPDAAPAVLREYPMDHYESPDLAVGAIGTDSIFSCPARAIDQVLSAQISTFAYEFNDTNAPELFLPPVSFPYGATHASELVYLFTLSRGGQLDEAQRKLSKDMIRYWTQFAKSGDPNSSGIPFWRQYDASTDEFRSLVPPSPMAELQFATDHKCDFWDKLLSTNTQVAARVANKPRPTGKFRAVTVLGAPKDLRGQLSGDFVGNESMRLFQNRCMMREIEPITANESATIRGPTSFAAQEQTSSRATVRGSVGPTSRSCWPSRAVGPLPSVAISMSAPPADIGPPSHTTRVAIGTAPSVRLVRVNAGSPHVAVNCCPRPTSTPLHSAAATCFACIAEQEGRLGVASPGQRRNAAGGCTQPRLSRC